MVFPKAVRLTYAERFSRITGHKAGQDDQSRQVYSRSVEEAMNKSFLTAAA
jgi:hypothetical protein